MSWTCHFFFFLTFSISKSVCLPLWRGNKVLAKAQECYFHGVPFTLEGNIKSRREVRRLCSFNPEVLKQDCYLPLGKLFCCNNDHKILMVYSGWVGGGGQGCKIPCNAQNVPYLLGCWLCRGEDENSILSRIFLLHIPWATPSVQLISSLWILLSNWWQYRFFS